MVGWGGVEGVGGGEDVEPVGWHDRWLESDAPAFKCTPPVVWGDVPAAHKAELRELCA